MINIVIEALEKEISILNTYINILKTEIYTQDEQILKIYIETESLPKTKQQIDAAGLRKANNTRYQVNDIRDLIVSYEADAGEGMRELAFMIYKANKAKGGQRGKWKK